MPQIFIKLNPYKYSFALEAKVLCYDLELHFLIVYPSQSYTKIVIL